MQVILYKLDLEPIEVNKDLSVTDDKKVTCDCVIKYPTDILNPTIRLTYIDMSFILKANYAYIGEPLNRYYYIENITIFNDITVDVYLRVDVNTSAYYNGSLDNGSYYIDRNETMYNSLLNDELALINNNDILIRYYYDVTTSDCVTLKSNLQDQNSYNYLVSTMSQGPTAEPVFLQTDSIFPNNNYYGKDNQFNNAITGSNIIHGINYHYLEDLIRTLGNDLSVASYVKYIKWCPFDLLDTFIDDTYPNTPIRIKTTDVTLSTDANSKRVDKLVYNAKICDFTVDWFNSFEDYAYAKYDLWIPFYGYIEIKPEYKNHNLKGYYRVCANNGSAYFYFVDATTENVIINDKIDLLQDVPFSYDDLKRIENEGNQKKMTAVISAVGTVMGALIATIASEGSLFPVTAIAVTGAASGVAAAWSTAEMSKKETTNYNRQIDNNGANGNCMVSFIRKIYNPLMPAYFQSSYTHLFGKPLKDFRTLSQLIGSGYTKMSEVHIKSEKLTDKEISELEDNLKKGVIFR